MTERVVETEDALVEIEIEKQGQIGKVDQQIFCFELFESARFGPQPLGDAKRYVGVLGKNAKFAKARALGLIQ